jgi:hypothetical protein
MTDAGFTPHKPSIARFRLLGVASSIAVGIWSPGKPAQICAVYS